MGERKNTSGCYIYFAAFATSLTAFATGSCFVWTSPLLPKFLSSNSEINPIGRPVTTSESAWIVSAMNLGMIFGPSVSIFSQKCWSKKTVLLISMGPIMLAHVTCFFAHKVIIFIFARLLMGLGTGITWSVLGTYIAEISEDRYRGLLGSIPGTMSNFGSLLVYAIGPYIDLTYFYIVILSPLIVFFVAFGCFVPDSPYDLVMRRKYHEAEKSLKTLRRTHNVEKELASIKGTTEAGSKEKVSLKDLVNDRGLRKGLLICVSLMICQQLSGILAVVSYAEIIFKLAGDFIPSAISAIIVAIFSTLGNLLSLVLVDKMGRKVLLTSSCILESASLFSLGLYFYLLNSDADVSAISWMPIVCILVFSGSFNLALGVIPWIVTGEVFHSDVKTLASTIIAQTNFTLSFLVSLSFPYMVEYLGMEWTFWTFSMCMVLGSIFCWVVLPETKGKSFQEIQKLLKG